jgi:hypothetical protein
MQGILNNKNMILINLQEMVPDVYQPFFCVYVVEMLCNRVISEKLNPLHLFSCKGQSHEKVCEIMNWVVSFGLN